MTRKPSDDALDRALDAALTHALIAPDLPAGFRARVKLALTRVAANDVDGIQLTQLRQRLEREQDQRLNDLQQCYLRLRRRTLAALIGGAFAAGAAAALAMPWLIGHIGPGAPLLLSAIGASLGLAIAFGSWWVGPGVSLREFDIHKGQS
ncbi:MAG TPA: hypothetical protein VHY19_06025 [Steroidobacteraceae bacterium]|jgi:hypothetical protein|nr:hypothetical protein [Steroidobacteraceae bacterium]